MGASSSSTPDAAAATSSSSSTSTDLTTAQNTNLPKKRKNAAPVLNIMRRKRIRPTLIDDRVAISFFRELRLTRQWINSGTLLAWALSPSDPDFINIHDYVERSQNKNFGVKIHTILRIIPKVNSLAEDDTLLEFNLNPKTAEKHRMMLWHGTRVENIPSILQNGLKLPRHSGMLGAGIYFADRVVKSVYFCNYTQAGFGYLFLCEVLLDRTYDDHWLGIFTPFNYPPWGYRSVKGVGLYEPDPAWNMKIDGCTWPLGRTVLKQDLAGGGTVFDTSEYVIYNQAHVQPKYLIKFQRTLEPVTYKLY